MVSIPAFHLQAERREFINGWLEGQKGPELTGAEIDELVRLSFALSSKDSASLLATSEETVRTRRKRIYKKLAVNGANEILQSLLFHSLNKLKGVK